MTQVQRCLVLELQQFILFRCHPADECAKCTNSLKMLSYSFYLMILLSSAARASVIFFLFLFFCFVTDRIACRCRRAHGRPSACIPLLAAAHPPATRRLSARGTELQTSAHTADHCSLRPASLRPAAAAQSVSRNVVLRRGRNHCCKHAIPAGTGGYGRNCAATQTKSTTRCSRR